MTAPANIPYRQSDEPALDYYARVARLADADADYQASREAADRCRSDRMNTLPARRCMGSRSDMTSRAI